MIPLKPYKGFVNFDSILEWWDGYVWKPITISMSFLGLSDTPSSYSGQKGKVPVVNTDETALDFTDLVKPLSSAGNPHYTLSSVGNWPFRFWNFTGTSGNLTINSNVFSANDQFEGVVTGGAKTFIPGTGFTIRTPSGGSLIVNQYERFSLKFLSPTETVLTIVKTPISGPTILSATATLDFPTIAAGETERLTATVTGAALLDPVLVSGPDAIYNSNDSTIDAWVSAANTVTVRVRNNGSSSIDPGSGDFKIKVFK